MHYLNEFTKLSEEVNPSLRIGELPAKKTAAEIQKRLYSHIKNNLVNTHNIDECDVLRVSIISKIIANIIYCEVILDNDKYLQHLPILETIFDAIRSSNKIASFSKTKNWERAIRAAKIYNILYPDYFAKKSQERRRIFARNYIVAEEAKHLMELGYRFSIENGIITFANEENIRISSHIDGFIKELVP